MLKKLNFLNNLKKLKVDGKRKGGTETSPKNPPKKFYDVAEFNKKFKN